MSRSRSSSAGKIASRSRMRWTQKKFKRHKYVIKMLRFSKYHTDRNLKIEIKKIILFCFHTKKAEDSVSQNRNMPVEIEF